MEAKLKHLEFIQAVITRMATNSFIFKGWAITIATGLAAFAAFDSRRALLVVALFPTLIFWALDAYYLWLEHAFRDLYKTVAGKDERQIDFSMVFDRANGFRNWVRLLRRFHVSCFYGTIMVADVVGILLIRSK